MAIVSPPATRCAGQFVQRHSEILGMNASACQLVGMQSILIPLNVCGTR